MRWILLLLLSLSVATGAQALDVYQDLDEATERIERLKDKPYAKLTDEDGAFQSETLIFKDTQTGHEVWSLTMEECIEMANIERRNVYSRDGSVFSIKSNRAYVDPQGKFQKRRWTNINWVMNADLTKRRKLWSSLDGELKEITSKFDTWDRLKPRTLYYAIDDKLYRVTVGDGLRDNKAEVIYTFPNGKRKFLQNISDDDLLCIQDVNGKVPEDKPLFYVVDLKKDPKAPGFCLYRSFNYGGMKGIEGHNPDNEYRVHGISVSRDGTRVSWGYGSMTEPGESVGFSVPSNDLNAKPKVRRTDLDPWNQYQSHGATGIDDGRVYFSGPSAKTKEARIKGGWGLWVRPKLKPPVFTKHPAGGGHCTWSGNDPEYWFAHVYRKRENWMDDWVCDKIVAGNRKGEVVRLCTPYDRRRGGGRAGYDGIPRPNQSPDATKCWFHSSMMMPADTMTGSFIVVFRRPHAPTALKSAAGEIRFTPHKVSQEVKSYLLYRRDGRTWTKVQEVPAAAGAFKDVKPGTYMVTALEWSGLESDVTSPTLRAPGRRTGKPVKAWDKTAPAAPTDFTAVREEAGHYRLKWTAPADEDVRYYNLYFSKTRKPAVEQKRRFASPPAGTTTYLDWTAPKEGAAHYAVTAIDRQGNESKPAYASAANE